MHDESWIGKPYHRFAVSYQARHLIEVAKDLASNVFPASLLVVHNTSRGSEHHVTERAGGQHVGDPALDLVQGNAEAGRNHTALVQTAVELDDDLASTVVVDDLKVTDVA